MPVCIHTVYSRSTPVTVYYKSHKTRKAARVFLKAKVPFSTTFTSVLERGSDLGRWIAISNAGYTSELRVLPAGYNSSEQYEVGWHLVTETQSMKTMIL
jgi:hypothetical protein